MTIFWKLSSLSVFLRRNFDMHPVSVKGRSYFSPVHLALGWLLGKISLNPCGVLWSAAGFRSLKSKVSLPWRYNCHLRQVICCYVTKSVRT